MAEGKEAGLPRRKIVSWKSLSWAVSLLVASSVVPAWSEERIILDGSSGMLPLANVLATAYQQKSSDPRIELGKGLGTGARLRALAEDKIQVALASHGIKPEDVLKGNLKVTEIAKGAIVFAVNASVPATDNRHHRGAAVRHLQWQGHELEIPWGPDTAIVVLTRPPTEVDPEVIRARIGCFKDLKEVDTAKVMARGGDMAKGLAETPHAIGMTSMTVVEQGAGKVKALTLNGVAPVPENVKSGRYFLTRDFLFVTKAEPSIPIRRFLDFVLSVDGDRVILANGAVPLR